MDSLLSAVRHFARDEEGITAIEYGLIAAVIVVAVTAVLNEVGTALTNVFTDIRDTLNA